MTKSTRTKIEDLTVQAQEGAEDGALSDEELDGVTGGMTFAATASIGQTVFAAHGTKERTNTNDNGCHDYDSEWDYSPY
jgi:hypothetical protein